MPRYNCETAPTSYLGGVTGDYSRLQDYIVGQGATCLHVCSEYTKATSTKIAVPTKALKHGMQTPDRTHDTRVGTNKDDDTVQQVTRVCDNRQDVNRVDDTIKHDDTRQDGTRWKP